MGSSTGRTNNESQPVGQQEDQEKVWRLVLDGLKREITDSNFEAYFTNTHIHELTDDKFIVAVADAYTAQAIQRRFVAVIEDIVKEVTSRDYKVACKVVSTARKRVTPKPRTQAVVKLRSEHNLNPKYTMENFVVGESNRFAHAVALAVSKNPGNTYNPLFYYGGVGLGKTHLMQAIGHNIYFDRNDAKIVFLTSEVFSNEYIFAIQNNRTDRFRKRYRSIDLLLIDDVQFFAGKERLQEEFFHTFNDLYQAGKQIVLTSDRPPKLLQDVQERLVSRFSSGVVADLRSPELETRIAILKKLASSQGIEIGTEELGFLAEKIATNIRELEGAYTKIIAYASLTGQPITISLIEETLKEFFVAAQPRRLTLELIRNEVASFFGISSTEIVGKRRTRKVVFPRQVAMYISRQLTEDTLTAIGKAFGKCDHTTVIHACEKIEKILEEGGNEAESVRTLKIRLKELGRS